MMMKLQIAAGLVVAAVVGLNTTTANAVNKPTSLLQITSPVQQVACTGHLRAYNSFSHCMTFKRNTAKYCSKICS
jgi:hypothetical protein